jgi:hypothetical protein
MSALYTNNAATTLASGITNVATSLTVAAATGGLFPSPTGSDYFYITLENAAGTVREIVKCTSRSTDTLTIVRGQDGTSASAFSTGDKVELRLVAAELNNIPQLDKANTFTVGTQSAPNFYASNGIIMNDQIVSSNVTIAVGDSGYSIGPMSVASGVTVTVASGSRWVIL